MVQKEHETIKKQYDILLQSTEQVERVMKQQLERREQDKIVIEQLLSENAVLQSRLVCLNCLIMAWRVVFLILS